MNVFIKVNKINVDFVKHLSTVMGPTMKDTLKEVREGWLRGSTGTLANTTFSMTSTEFTGTMELKSGWDSHKQGKQLYNHIPPRQPVSHLNRPNSIPQWGRMVPTSKAPPPKVSSTKLPNTDNPRDIYFSSSTVSKGGSPIQDTFSEVFKSNYNYVTGQRGGL